MTIRGKYEPLEASWIEECFLHREPTFYNDLMSGNEIHKVRDVPPGAQNDASFDFKKYVWGTEAPIVGYQQGNSTSCMMSSLASALLHIGDKYAAEYVLKRQLHANDAHSEGRMNFCAKMLVGRDRQPEEQRIKYTIEKWKVPNSFDILCNVSMFPTVCQLIDKKGGTGHCVTVCGKWVFDSNFKKSFPLSLKWMNFICNSEDDTDNGFSGVMTAIRAFPHKTIISKMKTNS